MTNILFTLQATGAATEAVLSLQRAQKSAPGIPLQESVRVLCQALKHLQAYLAPKPPRAPRKAPPLLLEALPPIPDPSPMRVDHPLAVQEINGCKALLLEVVRRAAYDWVLYRTSRRLQYKKLAEDAFLWLFSESPGDVRWTERAMSQKSITSFVAICEALDLDPDAVRVQIRKLTIKNVMSVGRPAEYRRTEWREEERLLSPAIETTFEQYEEEVFFDDLPNFD